MSNEQPPVRKVVPYKSGNRPSTFRRLNIDFVGTALEEALNAQEHLEQDQNIPDSQGKNIQTGDTGNQPPPVTTSHHHSPAPTHKGTLAEEPNAGKTEQNHEPPLITQVEGDESPPLTTTPQQNKKSHSVAIAPERDFNRRANSLERDALPSGLFPGSTKKVYDALYLRTIGAIVPVKRVKASRRDLLVWTGIRNLKTIDNHIRYLMARGLIVRQWELGSNEGSSYEVRLPEEIQDQLPPVTTSGGEYPPVTTSQFLGIPTTQKMGSGGEGQTIENAGVYLNAKTSFKTNTERSDDDDAALAAMNATLKQAAKELTGKEVSPAESARWRELAEVLVTEAKIAAARTTVSNFPAFLAEHLRRRLWKKDKSQLESEGRTEAQLTSVTPSLTEEQIKSCPDCGGSTWYYPEGTEKGIKRCRHEKLRE